MVRSSLGAPDVRSLVPPDAPLTHYSEIFNN